MPLYSWQEPACLQTMRMLESGNLCCNLSDTGTGKTFIALEALKRLQLKAVVWCPKTVIGSWRKVAELTGATDVLLDVKNPEQIVRGNTPWFKDNHWNLPEKTVLIVDEVHRGCSGMNSKQTKVLALTKAWKLKVMPMSATIADSPLKLRAVAYLAGLHDFSMPAFLSWCRSRGCFTKIIQNRLVWDFPRGDRGKALMAELHTQLSPHMVRLRVKDLPDFPTTSIQPALLTLPARATEEFKEAYDQLDVRIKQPGSNAMVELLRARQRTEHLKVPAMSELIDDSLEAGQSVVVLVQFRDTLAKLEQLYPWMSQLHGDQTADQRQKAIDKFQTNEVRLIAGIMQAGGLGVSLHDLDGQHPRVAYHTPPWSASDLRQALGRVWGAGGTHSVQHIVLAADTVEERVYKAVMQKSGNIDALQDGDLV